MNSQPYEVVPIRWVESPLAELTQAPSQGDEGAPPAWLAFETPVSVTSKLSTERRSST